MSLQVDPKTGEILNAPPLVPSVQVSSVRLANAIRAMHDAPDVKGVVAIKDQAKAAGLYCKDLDKLREAFREAVAKKRKEAREA